MMDQQNFEAKLEARGAGRDLAATFSPSDPRRTKARLPLKGKSVLRTAADQRAARLVQVMGKVLGMANHRHRRTEDDEEQPGENGGQARRRLHAGKERPGGDKEDCAGNQAHEKEPLAAPRCHACLPDPVDRSDPNIPAARVSRY